MDAASHPLQLLEERLVLLPIHSFPTSPSFQKFSCCQTPNLQGSMKPRQVGMAAVAPPTGSHDTEGPHWWKVDRGPPVSWGAPSSPKAWTLSPAKQSHQTGALHLSPGLRRLY